ncbi:MAG: hypothetical protein NC083_09065 [Muribaculum sp.]|nr:hypothetical protein [Muribaculum sp.]MCM1577096.1 hypothetical protein [Bacteroides sp.]
MSPFTDFDYEYFADQFAIMDDGYGYEHQDTGEYYIEIEVALNREYKISQMSYDLPIEIELVKFYFNVVRVEVTDEDSNEVPFDFDSAKLEQMVLERCINY